MMIDQKSKRIFDVKREALNFIELCIEEEQSDIDCRMIANGGLIDDIGDDI